LSPDIGRKHREVNAHLALNNAHFGNYIPTSIAIQFFLKGLKVKLNGYTVRL
jgi:hypothetical protein